MRFAYIDSQGNELPIPSVDALGLRIELGAIGPETQLYDAQADRWGPANTHEIYHMLSRVALDDGAFQAPPPLVRPSATAPLAPRAPAAPPASPTTLGDIFALDLGEAPTPPPASPPGQEEGLGLGFSLTLTDQPKQADPLLPPAEDAAGGGFDFGGGGLELEGASLPDPPMGPGGVDRASARREGEMDFGGSMGGGLDLEQPLSAFDASSPASWTEQMDSGTRDVANTTDFGPGDDDDWGAPPIAPHEGIRRSGAPDGRTPGTPRSRPSPPRRPPSRSAPLLLGSVLAVGVAAVGGWLGWQLLQNRGGALGRAGGTAGAVLPEVTIPEIPEHLVARFRELGDLALAKTLVTLRGIPRELQVPAEPRSEWLDGAYLADASRFGDVEQYWLSIASFVDRVRDTDTRAFHEAFTAELDAAGVPADTAAILLERADSGFLATRADRFEAYALMNDVANAALDLHQFLVENEASIQHTPAAGGVSADPVLEAVPDTPLVGDRMWDLVTGITDALDALGTLERVTTDRLSFVLLERVAAAGYR